MLIPHTICQPQIDISSDVPEAQVVALAAMPNLPSQQLCSFVESGKQNAA
jgi:hypothetical protein